MQLKNGFFSSILVKFYERKDSEGGRGGVQERSVQLDTQLEEDSNMMLSSAHIVNLLKD